MESLQRVQDIPIGYIGAEQLAPCGHLLYCLILRYSSD